MRITARYNSYCNCDRPTLPAQEITSKQLKQWKSTVKAFCEEHGFTVSPYWAKAQSDKFAMATTNKGCKHYNDFTITIGWTEY